MEPEKSVNPVVLISEDDPDDLYLFRSAVMDADRCLEVHNVLTGRQLVQFLLQTAVFVDQKTLQLPRFIIADLNRPFFELDIIREIRVYTQFRAIPIFVFSMENSDHVREKAMEAGATGFFKKPYTYVDLRRIVHEIVVGACSQNRLGISPY